MAQDYKVKSVKKGKDAGHGNFWYYLFFEEFDKQVSFQTPKEPVVGGVMFGNIEEQKSGDNTYYRFRKEKKEFSGNPEYQKKQEEKQKQIEEEKREKTRAMLASFCTSYATRMVIDGIVPYYQKGYNINDLSNDILDLILEQDVPLSPIDRSPFFSYAIDLFVKYRDDKKDISKKIEDKFKLTDKIEEINEMEGDIMKPKKVFSLFRGLIVNTKKLHEKLSN